MRRLILLATILISSCSKPYIQPELPLPPPLMLPTLTHEQEDHFRSTLPTIYEIVIRREISRQRRIETLENIIKTTH